MATSATLATSALAPRAAKATEATGPSSSPAPISWPPSEYWDGDDGNWSSFPLQVGNPEQIVRVLISTAVGYTGVILPGGCPPGTPGINTEETCTQSRGETFDPTRSSTWSAKGNYSLEIETNLGFNDEATYGFDTLSLGLNNASNLPTLRGQVIAGIEAFDFYTGYFGLGDQPSNFTSSQDNSNLSGTTPYPSFLSTLKSQNLIPSLSWAYTAGAYYQSKGFFGSLTFGGYDLSRQVPNNVTFDLAPDNSRNLVVGLQSITSTNANGSQISLLPNPILTLIDSTLPWIWLPVDACQEFERAFDLTWNDTALLYLVNDTLHESLIARNANFTFQIANTQTGGPTVDIVLPYASFDLLASYPLVTTSATRYFPLIRATNSSQYTLGRTFLQEAYLVTNYEYSNFSVSQARFEEGLPENIIALPAKDPLPKTLPATESHDHLSRSAIIGLSFGVAIFVGLLATLVFFTRKRLRKRKNLQTNDVGENAGDSSLPQDVKPANLSAVHEIGDNTFYFQRELPDSGKVELLDKSAPSGSGNKILEMAHNSEPAPLCELGTRHTSIASSSLRRQSDRNRRAIIVKTGILHESVDSASVLNASAFVETVISSSPRRESPSISPERPQWTPEYLNRALPSIPSSDSTQGSPTKTISSANGIHSLSSRTTAFSESEMESPETAVDMIFDEYDLTSEDYDMSWDSNRRQEPPPLSACSADVKIMMVPSITERQVHEFPSLSSLSADMEITAPPGTPTSQTTSRPSNRKTQRVPPDNFF
ncbi:aspartic peptidase domain-containing protein [Usnea florida]